jgi:hypothetical protein
MLWESENWYVKLCFLGNVGFESISEHHIPAYPHCILVSQAMFSNVCLKRKVGDVRILCVHSLVGHMLGLLLFKLHRYLLWSTQFLPNLSVLLPLYNTCVWFATHVCPPCVYWMLTANSSQNGEARFVSKSNISKNKVLCIYFHSLGAWNKSNNFNSLCTEKVTVQIGVTFCSKK